MSKFKRMNKLFAVLLVFTFVAGLLGTAMPQAAYAAEDEIEVDIKKLVSDIEDKDAKEAVLRLAAFKIIHGKEDNKYHPEDMVTREEFAKILVTSLKMDTAVKAGLGFTNFKDVEATRWSAGYIGIAAGQGLIKGYPDGTFKPANQVSYAEAVTMLVRALGYKDEFLSGQWPANYLAKAGEKEITKKVKFGDAYGFANRGDVAIMVNNTLDAKVVKVIEYTAGAIKYEERDVTLLEDKLNIEKLEDVRVLANKRVDDGLLEDEVRLREYDGKKRDRYDDKEYDFVGDVNPELVLGEEINAYLNDDDEVIYLEKKTGDKAYFDYIEKAILKDKRVEQLKLVKADDDYEFDEYAVIYYLDGDKYKEANLDDDRRIKDLDRSFFDGKVGKFVIRNRKIMYAEVMDMNEAYPWMIVFENKDGMLKGICADDDEFELDLTKDGNYDGVIVLDLEGYELDADDIEKGNLIYVQKQEYDGDDYAVVRVVKDNILEGKLDRVQDNKVKVGKVERKVTYFNNASGRTFESYYSIDDGEEIKQFAAGTQEIIDDMDDADEEDVIAYTDAVGRIAYFVTAAEAASGYKYGIVKRVYADKDRIKVFTIADDGEDDDFIYRVEEEDNVKNPLKLNAYGQKTNIESKEPLKEGSVIKFKLNKDGEIAEDKLYVMNPANLWKMTASGENGGKNDFGKDYLPMANLVKVTDDGKVVKTETNDNANIGIYLDKGNTKASFSVDDNTVIIDAEKYVFSTENDKFAPEEDEVAHIIDNIDNKKYFADLREEDFAKGDWKSLKDSNGIDAYFYVFCDDDKEVNAKAVVFIGDASGSAANDEIGIYAIKKWYKGGDTYVDYIAYGEDKIESRVVDNDDSRFFLDYGKGKENPYIAKVKSNGKLEIVNPGKSKDGFGIFFGEVESRKSDSLTLIGTYELKYVDGNDILVEKYDEVLSKKKMFNISNKTIVYEEDTKKNTSNLSAGDKVMMVVEKGNNVRVIERLLDEHKFEKKIDEKIANDKVKDDEAGGVTGDITFKVGEGSKALLTSDVSRSVSVEVYAPINWTAGDINKRKVKVDMNLVKASGIAARSVTGATTADGNKIQFTAVFKDEVYVGDTLEILKNAITVEALDGNNKVIQKATVEEAKLPITKKESKE